MTDLASQSAALTADNIRAALDGLLERRTDQTRLTSMGAGSDDLDEGRAYLAATVDGGWHVPTWPSPHGGRAASVAEHQLIGSVLRAYLLPDLHPFALPPGMVRPAPVGRCGLSGPSAWPVPTRNSPSTRDSRCS